MGRFKDFMMFEFMAVGLMNNSSIPFTAFKMLQTGGDLGSMSSYMNTLMSNNNPEYLSLIKWAQFACELKDYADGKSLLDPRAMQYIQITNSTLGPLPLFKGITDQSLSTGFHRMNGEDIRTASEPIDSKDIGIMKGNPGTVGQAAKTGAKAGAAAGAVAGTVANPGLGTAVGAGVGAAVGGAAAGGAKMLGKVAGALPGPLGNVKLPAFLTKTTQNGMIMYELDCNALDKRLYYLFANQAARRGMAGMADKYVGGAAQAATTPNALKLGVGTGAGTH